MKVKVKYKVEFEVNEEFDGEMVEVAETYMADEKMMTDDFQDRLKYECRRWLDEQDIINVKSAKAKVIK